MHSVIYVCEVLVGVGGRWKAKGNHELSNEALGETLGEALGWAGVGWDNPGWVELVGCLAVRRTHRINKFAHHMLHAPTSQHKEQQSSHVQAKNELGIRIRQLCEPNHDYFCK